MYNIFHLFTFFKDMFISPNKQLTNTNLNTNFKKRFSKKTIYYMQPLADTIYGDDFVEFYENC